MGWQWAGLVVAMAGHLHLQLRHYALELVVDRNISYGQMLRSGDTVAIERQLRPQLSDSYDCN